MYEERMGEGQRGGLRGTGRNLRTGNVQYYVRICCFVKKYALLLFFKC